MQCVSVEGDLTRHRYKLRGLVSQKSLGFSVKLMFVECGLILSVQEILCERDLGRVPIDFSQIQSFCQWTAG